MARFDDAVRLADKVDMPNVGASFNLCNWIRLEGGELEGRPLLPF